MKTNILAQISSCSKQFKVWKELALSTNNIVETKKFLEKALFWLELQTALIFLWNFENFSSKQKVIKARMNICKKLIEYAKRSLEEIKL